MREISYLEKPLYVDSNSSEMSFFGKITFSSATEIYFISNLDASKPLVKITGEFSQNTPILSSDIIGKVNTITVYSNGKIVSQVDRTNDPISASSLAGFQKYSLKYDDYFESNALKSQDDFVSTYEGNDSTFLKSGNDMFDGGVGIDTSIYSGKRDNYIITSSKEAVSVIDRTGVDGSDSLLNVERLKFTDATIALDVDGGAGSVYRLYQAAFNRVPDLSGLGFWIAQADKGESLSSIAAQFVRSSEFQNMYGATATNEKLVNTLYQNILHRPGEQGGIDFWVGLLNSGVSKEQVLSGFSESAENKAALLGLMQNGFEYDPWMG